VHPELYSPRNHGRCQPLPAIHRDILTGARKEQEN
jgi:hypothetical protein